LASNWQELKSLTEDRGQKLDDSLAYQNWRAAIEEELSWINEKQHVISSSECGNTLAAAQGLLKKHDAFETDFNVHRERVDDIISQGLALIEQGNHHGKNVQESLDVAREMIQRFVCFCFDFNFILFHYIIKL
jgi:spectrin alpha